MNTLYEMYFIYFTSDTNQLTFDYLKVLEVSFFEETLSN